MVECLLTANDDETIFGKDTALETDVVGVTALKLVPLCRNILGLFLKQWSVVVGAGRGRIVLFAARFAAAWANERRFGVGEKVKGAGGAGWGAMRGFPAYFPAAAAADIELETMLLRDEDDEAVVEEAEEVV